MTMETIATAVPDEALVQQKIREYSATDEDKVVELANDLDSRSLATGDLIDAFTAVVTGPLKDLEPVEAMACIEAVKRNLIRRVDIAKRMDRLEGEVRSHGSPEA
jgi:hypothetical protein